MVYLFLDFFGVTHPVSAQGEYFRPMNITALEQAVAGYEVRIVVTSTWRFMMSLDELRAALSSVLGPLVIGSTPRTGGVFRRYARQAEVEAFLRERSQEGVHWIAIDDNPGYYRPDAPLYVTDGRRGFTTEDVERFRERVIQLFAGE